MHALFLIPFLLKADPAPLMPTGSSPEFQATAYKVEQLLGDSKFEEAAQLLKRLPNKTVTLQWDDSAVPELDKVAFAEARDGAIRDWKAAVPGFDVQVKQKGDIKVSFTDVLPPAAGKVEPAGAVFFTSDSPTEPRTEAVIALKRATPPERVVKRVIQNEVGYAIGSYLGIAKLPRPVGYMGRVDLSVALEMRVNPYEIQVAKGNLTFVDVLANAVTKKLALTPTKPEMFINPSSLEGGEVPQDEPMKFSLEVTNRGNAPLNLRGFTECGCMHVGAPTTIEPGSTGLVQVVVDTGGLVGPFDKNFVVYSNDPEKSEQVVRVKAWVTPKYRFLRKDGPSAIVFAENNLKHEFFLAIDPKRPFTVSGVKINGVKAIADFEPWEGDLADPSLNEAAKPRKGYKITILASPSEQFGRVPVTFVISTDLKTFPTLYETVYAQWGISAPKDLNFGEVPKAEASVYFIMTRPGQPFKVLSVESDTDVVKASFVAMKNGDYKVTTTMLATVPVGRLNANITITTDDPKQSKIVVKVLAVVR